MRKIGIVRETETQEGLANKPSKIPSHKWLIIVIDRTQTKAGSSSS